MPDFDPKSIPILDDIIELDNDDATSDETSHAKTEAEQLDTSSIRTEPLLDDDTHDLFSELDNGQADDTQTATATDADTTDTNIEIDDNEMAESALIDYQAEENENQDHGQAMSEPQLSVSAEVTLDSVVEDVVKQLMPDLEQQLRFLVKQALEEKLPAAIIRQISSNKKNLS